MRIAGLRRYPVKSMLGEVVTTMYVDQQGAEGDRRLALIDAVTGRVASATQPTLCRELLQFSARWGAGKVRIEIPDGRCVSANEPGIDELLSRLLGRPVQLITLRPHGPRWNRQTPRKFYS